MSDKKPFRLLDFSVPVAGIVFLVLGITYFICFAAAVSTDEGGGEHSPAFEIIFRIITAPTYFLSALFGNYLPFIFVHVIALMVDAVGIAIVVHVVKYFLAGKGKR